MQEKRQVIVITGASGGLGRALCHAFSFKDHHIAVHVHRNVSAGQRRVETIKKAGGEAALFTADVRDSTSVEKMFEEIQTRWKQINLLINNAGVSHDRLFAKTQDTDFGETLGVNLSGVFFCMRDAGKVMSQHGGGHIINIASLSAYIGPAGQAAYAASKRGVIALTQTAAREWGAIPIQVNTVFPGFLPTGMTNRLTPSQKDKIIQGNLLGRPSTPAEVARFIVRLSQMKHVSGQIFNLDSRVY